MTPVLLSELARRMGGALQGGDPAVSGFSTDSRSVHPGDLFVAITGEQVDGHDFAVKALAARAAGVLAERPVADPSIIVPNIRAALSQMALSYRREFRGPVIGVTGSAGKTSTKEMIAAALAPLGRVLKSEANKNTDVSLPLLWPELEPDHAAVVAEMGMRGLGQIRDLCAFCEPTIGVITNIGTAHIELLGSRAKIAQAKSELIEGLPPDGAAILPADDDFYDYLASRTQAKVFRFGRSSSCGARVMAIEASDWDRMAVRVLVYGKEIVAEVPVIGSMFALNAAAALLTAHTAGVDVGDAAAALWDTDLPSMRMEVRRARGAVLLVDAYNANPAAMVSALETLYSRPATRRLALLGDMRELGAESEAGHRAVGAKAAELSLDAICVVGSDAGWIADEAIEKGMPADRVTRASGIDEAKAFLETIREGDVVLVKASRGVALEQALEGIA